MATLNKKRIIKNKKKSKKSEELNGKIYGGLSILVKEPSYEKKIFLLSDIIIDLDAFNHF